MLRRHDIQPDSGVSFLSGGGDFRAEGLSEGLPGVRVRRGPPGATAGLGLDVRGAFGAGLLRAGALHELSATQRPSRTAA